MTNSNIHLMLADDDRDDCLFFKEVLDELPVAVDLTTVNDGEELMRILSQKKDNLPDAIFLDLNMPRKSGFECLLEIKTRQELSHLPVIIFSTSFGEEVVDLLYERGAHHYIRKPGDFSKLKNVIQQALAQLTINHFQRPVRENFILSPQ